MSKCSANGTNTLLLLLLKTYCPVTEQVVTHEEAKFVTFAGQIIVNFAECSILTLIEYCQ